jgi:hypothetical protein
LATSGGDPAASTGELKMTTQVSIDKVLKVLDHKGPEAAGDLRGVDVHVDNPLIAQESFFGTDGVTDLFVFDPTIPGTNVPSLSNFDPGEDYLLFQNMDGRELAIAGPLYSDGSGFFAVVSPDASDSIHVFGVPYQQSTLDQMILPFDGNLVVYHPFPDFFI